VIVIEEFADGHELVRDAQPFGQHNVTAWHVAFGKVEAAQARTVKEVVAGHAQVAGLGPGIGDPSFGALYS
jgi:hypothetical protein